MAADQNYHRIIYIGRISLGSIYADIYYCLYQFSCKLGYHGLCVSSAYVSISLVDRRSACLILPLT